MGATEINAGTPAIITMTFYDKTTGTKVLADPSAATLVIRPGYTDADAVTKHLADFVHVSTGIYTYSWDTTGVAPYDGDEVECATQVQSTGGVLSTSDPVRFIVVPPKLPGLT